jgi:hypothetical protein
MRTHRDSINYYLVFGSQHYLGLEKMKDAMRSVDKSGGYRFCDASHNQNELFQFDDVARYADILFARYKGKDIQLRDVRDTVLLETPFSTPNSLLKALELSAGYACEAETPHVGAGLSRKKIRSAFRSLKVNHEPPQRHRVDRDDVEAGLWLHEGQPRLRELLCRAYGQASQGDGRHALSRRLRITHSRSCARGAASLEVPAKGLRELDVGPLP